MDKKYIPENVSEYNEYYYIQQQQEEEKKRKAEEKKRKEEEIVNFNDENDNKNNNDGYHDIITEKVLKEINIINKDPKDHFDPSEFKKIKRIGEGSYGKIYVVQWIKNKIKY